MIAVCGCFLATIIGFLVGVIRLSSNWIYFEILPMFTSSLQENVPVLVQIILYYSILLHLPKIKQAIILFDNFYLTNRGLFSPQPIFKDGFSIVVWSLVIAIIVSIFLKRSLKKKTGRNWKAVSNFFN